MCEQQLAFLGNEGRRILDAVHATIVSYPVTVDDLVLLLPTIGEAKAHGFSVSQLTAVLDPKKMKAQL